MAAPKKQGMPQKQFWVNEKLSVVARHRTNPRALDELKKGLAFEIDNTSFFEETIAFRQAFQANETNAPLDMETASPAGPNPKQVVKDQGKSILNPCSSNISHLGDAPVAGSATDLK